VKSEIVKELKIEFIILTSAFLLLPFRERSVLLTYTQVAAEAALPWAILFVTFGDKGTLSQTKQHPFSKSA